MYDCWNINSKNKHDKHYFESVVHEKIYEKCLVPITEPAGPSQAGSLLKLTPAGYYPFQIVLFYSVPSCGKRFLGEERFVRPQQKTTLLINKAEKTSLTSH